MGFNYKDGTEIRLGDMVTDVDYGAGTVVEIKKDGQFGVVFNKYNGDLHELSGLCKNGHGWWFLPSTTYISFVSRESSLFDDFNPSDVGCLM